MIVGFTCGTFDLVHAGHVLMLKEIFLYTELSLLIFLNPEINRMQGFTVFT